MTHEPRHSRIEICLFEQCRIKLCGYCTGQTTQASCSCRHKPECPLYGMAIEQSHPTFDSFSIGLDEVVDEIEAQIKYLPKQRETRTGKHLAEIEVLPEPTPADESLGVAEQIAEQAWKEGNR